MFRLIQVFLASLWLVIAFMHSALSQPVASLKPILGTSNQVGVKTLKAALKDLEVQYGVFFLYENKLIEGKVTLSYEPRENRLSKILTQLLEPLALRYEKIKQDTYAILPAKKVEAPVKSIGPTSLLPESAQYIAPPAVQVVSLTSQPLKVNRVNLPVQTTVRGRVVSEIGEGLPGVTVVVKGTAIGTVTDVKGDYSMTLPDGAKVLVFSFVGYLKQEVNVGNQTTVNVQLQPDTKSLDEVVVVGYGTQNRRDITGSIVSVSAKQIEDQRITTLDQALQGQVAGVQVIQSTGTPGGGGSVRVRGLASIGSGTEPLYVIDGFPIANDAGSISQGNSPTSIPLNPLSSINPNDIENIEILKDASATAIYGSRGANGVVLITTKRGKVGQSKIEFNMSVGIQSPVRVLEMMNAREFAQMYIETRNFAYLDGGGDPAIPMWDARRGANRVPRLFSNQDSIGVGNNWLKRVLRDAPMQTYQITASGGTQTLRYAVTGSYLNQDGTLIGSGFKRYAFRSNIEAQLNKRMTLGFNIAPSYSVNNMVRAEGHYAQGGVLGQAAVASPMAPFFNPDGSYTRQKDYLDASSARDLGIASFNTGINNLDNPLASAEQQNFEVRQARILTNAYLDFELVKNLKF